MKAYNITSTNTEIIISLDKDSFETSFITSLIEKIDVEALAKKANFNKNVLELSEKIKEDWWKRNHKKYITKKKDKKS